VEFLKRWDGLVVRSCVGGKDLPGGIGPEHCVEFDPNPGWPYPEPHRTAAVFIQCPRVGGELIPPEITSRAEQPRTTDDGRLPTSPSDQEGTKS
jgi:hypothetical protein